MGLDKPIEKCLISFNMSKKSFTQNILKYTVFFEPAQEGGFIAKVPNLPGCATQGESFEEAKNNIKEAIEGYLAVLAEEKQRIPKEQDNFIITQVTIPNCYGVV